MAAVGVIAKHLGVERAKPVDVALALAYAYGQVLGIYAMSGASNDQLAALGRVAARASRDMVSQIQVSDCAGSA